MSLLDLDRQEERSLRTPTMFSQKTSAAQRFCSDWPFLTRIEEIRVPQIASLNSSTQVTPNGISSKNVVRSNWPYPWRWGYVFVMAIDAA